MQIIENVTIYKCDFCKKELKRKHAMINHEIRCGLNPVNDRICLHCPNLKTKEIEIDTLVTGYDGEPVFRKAAAFYCAAKEILLLHPKTKYLQHRDTLNYVYLDNKETEQFEMLTECDIQKEFMSELDQLLK